MSASSADPSDLHNVCVCASEDHQMYRRPLPSHLHSRGICVVSVYLLANTLTPEKCKSNAEKREKRHESELAGRQLAGKKRLQWRVRWSSARLQRWATLN